MNSNLYGQLILNKAGKYIQWKKKIVLGHMGGPVKKACDGGFSSGHDLRAVQSMRGILSLHISLPLFCMLALSLSLKNKYIN